MPVCPLCCELQVIIWLTTYCYCVQERRQMLLEKSCFNCITLLLILVWLVMFVLIKWIQGYREGGLCYHHSPPCLFAHLGQKVMSQTDFLHFSKSMWPAWQHTSIQLDRNDNNSHSSETFCTHTVVPGLHCAVSMYFSHTSPFMFYYLHLGDAVIQEMMKQFWWSLFESWGMDREDPTKCGCMSKSKINWLPDRHFFQYFFSISSKVNIPITMAD